MKMEDIRISTERAVQLSAFVGANYDTIMNTSTLTNAGITPFEICCMVTAGCLQPRGQDLYYVDELHYDQTIMAPGCRGTPPTAHFPWVKRVNDSTGRESIERWMEGSIPTPSISIYRENAR